MLPPVLLLCAAAMLFFFTSLERERRDWEATTFTLLRIQADSSLVRTYAEYRSFGLDQEAAVYEGYIRDDFISLALLFGRGSGDVPRICLIDREGRRLVGVAGRAAMPEDELAHILAFVDGIDSSGMTRPAIFGEDGPYRFVQGVDFDSSHYDVYFEIQDPFRTYQQVFLAVSLGIAVLLTGFLMLADGKAKTAVKRITDPIEHLTEISRAVMEGRIGVRATRESDDEIGTLADAFNSMLDELMRLIAERTRILESIADGFIALDGDWRFSFANAEAERILGACRADLIGKAFWEVFPGSSDEVVGVFLRQVMDMQAPGEIEHKDAFSGRGAGRWISLRAYPVEDGGISVYLRDVTVRREAVEALRESLREKEILLREVHHRVKNNMQVISSMIYLQRSSLGNPDYDAILETAESRIRSMALVHESLYRSDDFASIELGSFFAEFIGPVVAQASSAWEIEGEEIRLGLDKAVPCALAVNELVMNAIKYGGGAAGEGRAIRLSRKDGEVRIRVEDRGPGVDGIALGKKGAGIGLTLVDGLAKQLYGRLEWANREGGGAVFVLSFPEA